MPIKAGKNPVVMSDFLWDHVADGVSSDWKEEQQECKFPFFDIVKISII